MNINHEPVATNLMIDIKHINIFAGKCNKVIEGYLSI